MSHKFAGILPHVGSELVNHFVGNKSNTIVNWEAADHQMRIIQDEVDELAKAVATRNYNELRDGLNDARFTVDGGSYRQGINVQDDFDALMKSMMSKFDESEEDAIKSQQAYAAKGIQTEIVLSSFMGVDYYVQISAVDQTVAGKDYPKGKFLKSYKFEEPIYLLPNDSRALPPIVLEPRHALALNINEFFDIPADATGSYVLAQIRAGENLDKVVPNWLPVQQDESGSWGAAYKLASDMKVFTITAEFVVNHTDHRIAIDLVYVSDAPGAALTFEEGVLVNKTHADQVLNKYSSRQVPKVDLDDVLDLWNEYDDAGAEFL